jgi:hypothetical protein
MISQSLLGIYFVTGDKKSIIGGPLPNTLSFCTYFYISSYKIDDDLYTFLFEPKKNRGGTNIRDGGTSSWLC